jgi:PAS domain S-box-containing protein
MPARDAPDLIGVSAASQMLGLSQSRVRDLLRSGAIAGARRVGRVWLVDRESVADYLAGRQPQPEALAGAAAGGGGEDPYRLIADTTNDWEYWRAPDGTYAYCSPSCLALTGYSADEFMADGALLARIVHPDDRAALLEHESRQAEGVHRVEMRVIRRDGSECWIEHVCQQLLGRDGRYLGRRASNHDVTERRRLDREREQLLAALNETQARSEAAAVEAQLRADVLDAVFATAPAGIILLDADGRILQMNAAAHRALGYSLEEMRRPVSQRVATGTMITEEGEMVVAEQFATARALRGETVHSQVIGLKVGDRPRLWLSVSAASLRSPDGTITGAVATFSDVGQMRAIQQRLQELLSHEQDQNDELSALTAELERERQRLAVTLQSIGDGVIATDAGGYVTIINRAAATMTGWSEVEAIGSPLTDVLHIYHELTGDPAANPVAAVLATGCIQGLANHTVLVSRTGERRVLADSAAPIVAENGSPVGVVLVFQDVTERRHLDEERAKVNKLESLGVLAGGIAHDFNNLLTGILGNIVLARLDLGDDSPIGETLQDAEKAATRARGLTQQLLTFAKGGLPLRRATALPEVLREAAGFALRGSGASVQFDLPEDLWPADIDAGQIGQVVQNLVINADEAMAQAGTISITAGNLLVHAADASPLAPGRYVRFTVADEGPGIPRDIRDRVFDPYFTTKPTGSGIGLSVVYSVVAKHDGHVTFDPERTRGAAFHVYLPAAPALAASAGPESRRMARRGARVLLMDDEEMVRSVAERMLSRLGCTVVTTAEGMAAVALFGEALALGEPFDTVVLDVYVPGGVGGIEALAHLKRLDPDVRAIVSSGYSTHPVMNDYVAHGFAAAVAKPYRLDDLAAVLEQVLG